MATPNRTLTLTTRAHGINVAEFKARHEVEASARRMFYKDIDAGLMSHLSREFTKAPWHIQELYRSFARRTHQSAPVHPPPSVVARLLGAGRRFMGGLV